MNYAQLNKVVNAIGAHGDAFEVSVLLATAAAPMHGAISYLDSETIVLHREDGGKTYVSIAAIMAVSEYHAPPVRSAGRDLQTSYSCTFPNALKS